MLAIGHQSGCAVQAPMRPGLGQMPRPGMGPAAGNPGANGILGAAAAPRATGLPGFGLSGTQQPGASALQASHWLSWEGGCVCVCGGLQHGTKQESRQHLLSCATMPAIL